MYLYRIGLFPEKLILSQNKKVKNDTRNKTIDFKEAHAGGF